MSNYITFYVHQDRKWCLDTMDTVAFLSLELLHVIYDVPDMVETFHTHFSASPHWSLLPDTWNLHILDTRKSRSEMWSNCPKKTHLVC